MPFPLPSSDWKYKVSTPTPTNYTINLPSTQTLLEVRERGYIISVGLILSGSLDCQNFVIRVIEGILGDPLSEPVSTVTPYSLNSAGRVGFDNMPTVTRYDTTNKVFSIQWDPKYPIPFRGFVLSITAPPPTLDTATSATVSLAYLFAIESEATVRIAEAVRR